MFKYIINKFFAFVLRREYWRQYYSLAPALSDRAAMITVMDADVRLFVNGELVETVKHYGTSTVFRNRRFGKIKKITVTSPDNEAGGQMYHHKGEWEYMCRIVDLHNLPWANEVMVWNIFFEKKIKSEEGK